MGNEVSGYNVAPPRIIYSSPWGVRSVTTRVQSHERLSFGDYELDCRTGELCRNGATLRLQPQPAKVLTILVTRAGEVVTRQELTEQVWGRETYVDFEHGLNFAVRRIRSVLKDDPDNPRYLETIPKRGYRFIAAVSVPARVHRAEPPKRPGIAQRLRLVLIALGAALLVALFAAIQKWPQRAVVHGEIRSIAVLPLRNLSGDPEQEFFSEGMTDELITDLAKLTKLRVISHTSVGRYKNTNRPLADVARELGVDAVVEGTVMRSGDRVRITAQLIDARSDEHIWADSYEDGLRDVLGLQADVAKQITSEIGIRVTANEEIRIARTQRPLEPAAHEAYLKGSFYFDLASCRDFETALTYFEQAVARDPNFAPAYARLADTSFTLGHWRCWHTPPFDKAEAAASKAIEVEPSNARAHAVLAEIGFSRDWNWLGAGQQFSTAIDLDPNDAAVHSSYGMFLIALGKVEQGLAEERKAEELDPFSEKTADAQTWALYLAHRFDDAIDHAKRTVSISPAYGQYYWLGQCYEQKGLPDQALEYYLKTWSGMPEEVPRRRAAYQKGGLRGYWKEDERLRRRRQEKIDAVLEAMYYAHTGENNKAIEQLHLAYQQRVDGLQFIRVEPVYDNLRSDPRFKELLAKLGL